MLIIYAVLAVFGLGFLVFIHEMGHYLVARRVGMRVEAFAIGFGKPLVSWKNKEGVEWRICLLPFGGYVKIAGMEQEGEAEPYEIADGFFGSSPWNRIKVAVSGPVCNFAFAFCAFTLLWFLGGREKPFAEFTKRVGWIDSKSSLYEKGVRPGDEILQLNRRPFRGAKDLLLSSLMVHNPTEVVGLKIDYIDQERSEFLYEIVPYQDPRQAEPDIQTLGIFSPASYLIYEGSAPELLGAPLENSGIALKDRIFWVDGHLVFSAAQLRSILSDSSAFLTILRDGKKIHSKIPRVPIADLQLQDEERAALDDLRYNASLRTKPLGKLLFFPYLIGSNNHVEKRLQFLDESEEQQAFVQCTRCPFFSPLEPGDRILAVDGAPVQNREDLFRTMQEKRSLVIVERDPTFSQDLSWQQADEAFDRSFHPKDLQALVQGIGLSSPIRSSGNLHLLHSIAPKTVAQFPDSPGKQKMLVRFVEQEREILEIDSSEKRERYLQLLDEQKAQPYLGVYLRDRLVRYNPSPFALLGDVFVETGHTFQSLFSGNLHPKWLSGPVGILHAVQHSWTLGGREALFWMGLISLNLAILNLLPIPVLDGGHIAFSFLEMVRKKPIKAKTMQKMIVPFVVLFLIFFVFVTYHDFLRLLSFYL
ncbi:MAG: site-2 protease family protein [Chlamydiota bacterium]